ncbi:hypothetical protein FZC70_18280 [Bacillus subtilis]|nr:hypothetical protein FZC70_18280 [Bacillus subtilis]
MNGNITVTIGSMSFGSLTSGSIKISIAKKRKNAMTLARRRKRNTIVSLVKNTDALAVIAKD